MLVPTTAQQSTIYALDIDGEESGRTDNALGKILSTLSGLSDLNFQAAADAHISRGTIVQLMDLQAASFSAASDAGLRPFVGDPSAISPPPCDGAADQTCRHHLAGTGEFVLDSDSPTADLLAGTIVDGQLRSGPGTATVMLALVSGEAAIPMRLVGARLEIEAVSATGAMTGRIGGAMTEEYVDTVFLPDMHGVISARIATDCTGNQSPCCAPESVGATLIDLFDESEPKDCVVSLQELKQNSLIDSLLRPDVDLFDAVGNFNPRSDLSNDSLSVGIGFSGVLAQFTAP